MRRVPFKQAHLLSGVVIHYAQTVLCAKKWMACASSCTIAHLVWWGPVQSQLHTKVLPLQYPLSPYYYYDCCCCCCCWYIRASGSLWHQLLKWSGYSKLWLLTQQWCVICKEHF